MRLYGIFIGVNQYRDSRISPLKWAVSDAEVLYRLFKESIPPRDRQLFLLKNEYATKVNILKRIGEDIARTATRHDITVIYFAGHGSPETSDSPDHVSRYLITYDTEYDSIYATGLDLEKDLPRLLERLPTELVIVFLDACFSGRAGGRTFEGPHLRTLRSEFRSLVILRKLNLGEGRLILAGADDNEVAREEDRLQHGIFTHFLLERLTEHPTNTETIGLGEIYESVATKVRAYTDGRQNPVLNGRSKLAKLPILGSSAS